MNLHRPLALAASVSVLALGLAACGGDSSAEPTPPTPAPTEPAGPPAPPATPGEVTEPATPEPSPPAGTPSEPTPTEPTPTEPTPTESTPAEPAPPTAVVADNEIPTPTEVPADAVAIVGDTPIAKVDYDRLLTQREQATKAGGGEFPAAGTPEYETLKNQFVAFLVQREEFRQEAAATNVSVSDEDVTKRLDELKQQFFEGDDKKYQDELKKNGVTEDDVKRDLKDQVLSEKLYENVIKGVTVGEDTIKAYYDERVDDYSLPEQRELSHILVATKKEADDIIRQLNDGGDFTVIAKDKSTDTGSGANGGSLGKGPRENYVKPFGDAAWKLKTGEISAPVKSEFGWHVIKADGDIEPAKQQTLEEVREQIVAQLKSTAEGDVARSFIDLLTKKYEGKVLYATGYEPPPPLETETDAAGTESTP